jgi:hypothetical protein
MDKLHSLIIFSCFYYLKKYNLLPVVYKLYNILHFYCPHKKKLIKIYRYYISINN